MHSTPRLSANTRAWGLILVATRTSRGRRERAVAVEPLLVAQQLLDAGDLPDALHLDDDGASVAVAAEQVDRARGRSGTRGGRDGGRRAAPATRAAMQLLQLGLHAVLGEPGVVTELEALVEAAPRAAR